MSLTDEDLGLTTQPAPVAARPPRLSPLGLLVRSWRQLTSMRTALILLFLLALASIPGSLLPQRTQSPINVATYFRDHPDLAPVLDRFSLFDVFSAPWFAAIYLLLFISLAGCIVPRTRMHAKAMLAGPPRAPRNLSRLPLNDTWTSGMGSGVHVASASGASLADPISAELRSARWRVAVRDEADGTVAIAAEKGYLRETGNLVFHLALLLMLFGIAVGGLWGYYGTRLLVEGESFTNTVTAYDDFAPGQLVDEGSLTPFGVTLDDFRAEYLPDGKPIEFEADVTTTTDLDAPPRSSTLRVNHPVSMGGADLYLLGQGYAARVIVRDERGDVALDQDVPCLPQDGNFTSTCVIKVPDAQPREGSSTGPVARSAQFGFRGVLLPSPVLGPDGYRSVFPGLREPALALIGFKGDLGIDSGAPQSVYDLDTDDMEPVGGTPANSTKTLEVGDTWQLPGGGSVEFAGISQWATLRVTEDPGELLVLGSAIAVVAGLILSLTVRRRRLWVRLSPDDAGRTVVAVGGLARSDAATFRDEFSAATERVRAVAPEDRE